MNEILNSGLDAINKFASEIIVFGITAAVAALKRKWDLRKIRRSQNKFDANNEKNML